MEELNQWTDENIFAPLNEVLEGRRPVEGVAEQIEKAIRIKVLESYRNGAKRCPNCHGNSEKPAQTPLRRRFRRERQ
jgi:hypothetical protein